MSNNSKKILIGVSIGLVIGFVISIARKRTTFTELKSVQPTDPTKKVLTK